MRRIALFGEDYAHRQVIDALVRRLACEFDIPVNLDWRRASGGHGRVVDELDCYLRDLTNQRSPYPDLIVVCTDANCRGLSERLRELQTDVAPAPLAFAIPDPHIERWLLLDGAAFRVVFGRGCDAPDQKCDRDRYKQLLAQAIRDAGIVPAIGGVEFAEDLVKQMDIERAMGTDSSLRRFVEDVRSSFRQWSSE